MWGFFQRTAPSVFTSELQTEFGLDAGGVGTLASMYFYAYAIVQIPCGVALDTYGPLKSLCLSSLGAVAGSLLFALSPSLGGVFLGRFLIGGFVGVGWLAVLKILTTDSHFRRRQQMLSGTTMMLGMAGGALGQGPLALVIKENGWRMSMATATIVPLVCFVCVIVVLQLRTTPSRKKELEEVPSPTPDLKPPGVIEQLAIVSRVRTNFFLAIYSVFAFVPLLAFASLWSVPFIVQVGEVDQAAAGVMASFFLFGLGLGAPSSGAISDRFKGRKRTILLAGLSLSCVSVMLLVLFVGNHFLSYLLMFTGGVGQGPAQVMVFFLCRERNPANSAAAGISIVNTGALIAGAAFQPIIGACLDIGWDGSKGVNGERLWEKEHMRTVIGLILFLCYATAAAIIYFLVPADLAETEEVVVEIPGLTEERSAPMVPRTI